MRWVVISLPRHLSLKDNFLENLNNCLVPILGWIDPLAELLRKKTCFCWGMNPDHLHDSGTHRLLCQHKSAVIVQCKPNMKLFVWDLLGLKGLTHEVLAQDYMMWETPCSILSTRRSFHTIHTVSREECKSLRMLILLTSIVWLELDLLELEIHAVSLTRTWSSWVRDLCCISTPLNPWR